MRKLIGVFGVLVLALATILVLNFRGWRALIVTRLFRVDNQPVVVPAPPNFHPLVPSGFRVSVFASGFVGPRWMAIAPSGDVFVADSAAGQVVVLSDPQAKGVAESRAIFADRLTLPFGIAFNDNYVYIANTNEVVRFAFDPTTSKRLG